MVNHAAHVLPHFRPGPRCPFFFFSSRRRHTRCLSDWSSDVCSSDLSTVLGVPERSFGPAAASFFEVTASDRSLVADVLARMVNSLMRWSAYHTQDPYSDVIVHETAHLLHYLKPEHYGLRVRRGQERFVDVEFRHRELAFACEAFSRANPPRRSRFRSEIGPVSIPPKSWCVPAAHLEDEGQKLGCLPLSKKSAIVESVALGEADSLFVRHRSLSENLPP